MINRSKAFMPVIILFVILSGFMIAGKKLLEDWNADQTVLLGGNLLLFVITLLSFMVSVRGLGNSNPHAFVRSVYTSMMIKLFLCVIVAFIYISIAGDKMNKTALFTCMALYLVYSFFEVSILMKMLRNKPNE